MLFAISPGSAGTGPERYVASVPFVVAAGATLNMPDEAVARSVGTSSLTLQKLQLLYYLTLGPFETELEATRALDKLTAALLWSSLVLGIGIHYAHRRGTVTFFDAPLPIPSSEPMAHIGNVTGWDATDGHYDAEQAIVRPDHKRLTRWEVGQATLTIGLGMERFLGSLEQALALPDLERVIADDKLKLAIELYAGYRFELSANAKFITLVTALEALLPDVEIAPSSIPVLEKATQVVRVARDSYVRDTTEWVEIDRLLSRVGKLKYEAIGTSLRRFAESVILRNPGLGDPSVIAGSLRDAYSVRSRLLHDGIADQSVIAVHLEFLQTFVPRLLQTLFEESSGIRR